MTNVPESAATSGMVNLRMPAPRRPMPNIESIVKVLRGSGRRLVISLGWFSTATLIAVLGAGCSSGDSTDSGTPACISGSQHTCMGDTGCIGVQECSASGTWTSCNCDSTERPLLGGACDDDSGCAAGATCLLPSSTAWLGGGPPKGFCVADCTSDVAICSNFANAICVSAVGPTSATGKYSLCMPECDLGAGTPDAFACSAVPSSACEPLETTNAGFCRPFCVFDSDCPSGHCDRQLGICLNEAPAPPALAFGDTCEPSASGCGGVCLKLTSAASLCSNRCVFGDYSECATEGADPIAGVCAYATVSARPGNVGFCTPLCDCNDDCTASGFLCRAFSTKDTQTALSHVGMCVPAVDTAGTAQTGVACVSGG